MTGTLSGAVPHLGADSVVVLHDLVVRPDEGEWIFGRAATG